MKIKEKKVRASKCAAQITVSVHQMSIEKYSHCNDWIFSLYIEMDVTEEAAVFFRKIESDLSTSIPSHVKNSFL